MCSYAVSYRRSWSRYNLDTISCCLFSNSSNPNCDPFTILKMQSSNLSSMCSVLSIEMLLTGMGREMADILENCAMDPSHQPAIYAAFIREIVRKTRETRASSPIPAIQTLTGMNGTIDPSITGQAYDPQLLNQTADWQSGDLLGGEGSQFTFIPQGGDMM